MKLWIIDHYSSEPQYGGIQRQFDFANELSKRGHDVTVIASSFSHFSHKYISTEDLHVSPITSRSRYVYLRTTSYKRNDSIDRILNTLSFTRSAINNAAKIINIFGEPEVVVGCSIHPFTWIAAYIIAKKYNAKFIVEVRDLWPATWIYNWGMSKLHPRAIIFGYLEKWAYTKADKIIYSMSHGDKYICDELGFPYEKVVWIDQPMDCERYDDNAKRYDELPKEILKFISDSFICVFTGYYIDYEGVMEMLEAAQILEDKKYPIKFLFLGSGPEEKNMKSFVASNNLKNVYIGERIDKELIPAVLRRANICLAHLAVKGNRDSYKFGASKNKINEYMYSNSCIIYGTYIENQFVQTSGAGFTIEPYNAKAFAEKIEMIYLMPELVRKQFGENAKKYVIKNNTVQKLIDKYLQAIDISL